MSPAGHNDSVPEEVLMEFREGVAVYTPDGRHLGNVDHVVVDPASRRVTHIVVRQGHLLVEDKVIGVEELSMATGDRIVLESAPEKLTPFEESHYVPLDQRTRRQWGIDQGLPLLRGGWMAGDRIPYSDVVAERMERNIPKGDVAIEAGAVVEDANGDHVGRVLELITDRGSGRITDLVVEAGHLWGKHSKAIPVNWVAKFGEGSVTLAVGAKTLKKVPRHQPA
jgi:uncharacterized protein YrrD